MVLKRILLILLLGLFCLIAITIFQTFRFYSRQIQEQPADVLPFEREAMLSRFSKALQIQTVSHQDPSENSRENFQAFHQFLESAFPRINAALEKETVSDFSLMYRWPGSNPALAPVLLMAHQDVVPVEPATEKNWKHPPFSGIVADGFIWGRGSMDDKSSLLAIHEAIEALLSNDFQPKRTIYFAFGHDEEVGGRGAATMAHVLGSRKIRFESVLDEGLIIGDDFLSEIGSSIAFIGVAEKGYLTIELSVHSAGGHSSMPPKETAARILSAAIVKLEENQMPLQISDPTRQMFQYLGPEMPFLPKWILANEWLTKPLIQYALSSKPSGNAVLRTTTAPTILAGGVKENVLPAEVRATINFRILTEDSVESVLDHVRDVVNDDRVKIKIINQIEPSRVSRSDTKAFRTIHKTVEQIFPDTITTPALVTGATDSRHFQEIADDVYRFIPARFTLKEIEAVHSINERLSIKNYENAIRFYIQYLRNVQN